MQETNDMQGQPLLVRAEEVAELLDVSRSKVFAMMASGELPGVVRIGRSVRVSRASLERWVRERSGDETTGSAASSKSA